MNEPLFPLHGLSRLRMTTDGDGVTTLVTAKGCPLRCRYCINPTTWDEDSPATNMTPHQLYDAVKVDDLYFQATGGGVTFGGGEPLNHAEFFPAFRTLCGSVWKLRAETSLWVPREKVETAAGALDEFFVDIKDTDPVIYRRYTGQDNALVMDNLRLLLQLAGPDRVCVRVPAIPGYNTEKDIRRSLQVLADMGVTRTNVFTYRVNGESE